MCRTGLLPSPSLPPFLPEPEEAQRIAEKLEWHSTPKHGSWLNMVEIEFAALAKECLSRRIGSGQQLERVIAGWQEERNERMVEVKWRFTTADARIKLIVFVDSLLVNH